MRSQLSFSLIVALSALSLSASPARAAGPPPDLLPRAHTAAQRGLAFLVKDAAAWRNDRTCATCHHGTITLWALCEAKRSGYALPAGVIADTAKWTKDRLLERIDMPRDKRPGWSMVNTPAMYLGVMALMVPNQEAVSRADLKRIGGHLMRHQEADGSWSWATAPAVNRPPPVFESDEVATRLAYLALESQLAADPKDRSTARDLRGKAAAWLKKSPPNDTTQAAALRLLVRSRAKEPAGALQADIKQFLARQNKDGGWGQLRDRASDAYATGQALYVLRQAGLKSDRGELRRGLAFLIANQKEDGSWPMTRRGHPGVKPGPFTWPIIHLGSAWATLGLTRCVPR